jgi:hypothetical protein
LSIGPVFIFLNKQGYNTLKTIGTVDNIGDETLIPVNGSAGDLNFTYTKRYLFCRATHWYFNYSMEGWCVTLRRVCRGVDWVVVFWIRLSVGQIRLGARSIRWGTGISLRLRRGLYLRRGMCRGSWRAVSRCNSLLLTVMIFYFKNISL